MMKMYNGFGVEIKPTSEKFFVTEKLKIITQLEAAKNRAHWRRSYYDYFYDENGEFAGFYVPA